jgi:hypothetical protein
MQGVNLTTLESKCQCKFSDIINFSDNAIIKKTIGEIADFITNSNIFVLQCYQDNFQKKYFLKNTGGFIFIAFIALEVLSSILFFNIDMKKIFTHLYNLTKTFINSVKNKKRYKITNNNLVSIKENPPNRKKGKKNQKFIIRTNSDKINPSNIQIISFNKNGDYYKLNSNSISTYKSDSNFGDVKVKIPRINFFKNNQEKEYYTIDEINNYCFEKEIQDYSPNIKNKDNQNNENINIDEFLEPDVDDMDYDDAIAYDKRAFCVFYWERLKDKQMIINTFCSDEFLKPITMRLLLLILCFDLYFAVNGLFYTEEYISELFYSTKEEKFFSFFERSFERFIYTTFVGVILEYIIGFFFIKERKIKKLFLREKDNFIKIRYEIIKIIKDIKKRYIYFIIFCFIISIFSWYYVNCFNNVYPGVKIEWIKSSIAIIVIKQIIQVITSLIESILRALSFKCKSERLYELKRYLN